MKQQTFNKAKADSIYKHSAIPFIDSLINLNIPLSAIDINDWHSTTTPRVYVTREYGRKNGGKVRKAHLNQFGYKAAQRLANFYHALN